VISENQLKDIIALGRIIRNEYFMGEEPDELDTSSRRQIAKLKKGGSPDQIAEVRTGDL
jgi:hypothetical protein